MLFAIALFGVLTASIAGPCFVGAPRRRRRATRSWPSSTNVLERVEMLEAKVARPPEQRAIRPRLAAHPTTLEPRNDRGLVLCVADELARGVERPAGAGGRAGRRVGHDL